jgi:osmotically-inducible protein OsmY
MEMIMNTTKKNLFLSRSLKSTAALALPLMVAFAPLGTAHAAAAMPDAALADRVAATLAAAPDVELHQVGVRVHDGVVMLTGFVDTPRESVAATRLAKAVDPGVVVDNRLRTWSATDYE